MNPNVQRAVLALLLEVASTPTAGNVDRHRDLGRLRFEHFLAGAIGAEPGLLAAAEDEPIGVSFERAIAGMSNQRGGNTQFGALLLLVPLVKAAGTGSLTPDRTRAIATETTVADAAAFYRSFEHVSVAVGDPPSDVDVPDVRRGSAAIPELVATETTLADVMVAATAADDIAREWINGFPRTFDAARRLERASGTALERGARVHLELLADRPDTFVAKRHGWKTAEQVRETARSLLDAMEPGGLDRSAVTTFGDDLADSGINPGTTADLLAGGFYVALDRGLHI